MAKNYANIAKEVLRLVGGEKNVSHFEHCSTRLRFTIADPSMVDKDGLKKTSGVMGVVGGGNQCQVVIGNDVTEVFDEINKIATFGGGPGPRGEGQLRSYDAGLPGGRVPASGSRHRRRRHSQGVPVPVLCDGADGQFQRGLSGPD